ncbi:MAG: hypothetical protein RL563_955, partial [Pseudomonadota bacterium]
ECDQATLEELEAGFRFNDAILRSQTLLQKEAITEPSAIATSGNDGQKTSNRVKDEIEEEAEVETVAVVAEEADVEADAE